MGRRINKRKVVFEIITILIIVWLGSGVISWVKSYYKPATNIVTKQPEEMIVEMTLPEAQVITSKKSRLVVDFPVGEISYTTVDKNSKPTEKSK